MESKTALGGPARDVVLDPVALEHANAAVVHLHRESHEQLAPDVAQHRTQPGGEVEDFGGVVELTLRVEPGVVDHRRSGN